MFAKTLRHPINTTIALLIGGGLGLVLQAGWLFSVREVAALFFQLLTAIAIPLIIFSVISYLPKILAEFSIGKHLVRTVLFFVGLLFVMVQLMLLTDVVLNTSFPFTEAEKQLFFDENLGFESEVSLANGEESLQSKNELLLFDVIRTIIPSNMFDALYGLRIYSIIFVAILLGAVFSRFSTKETRFFLQISEGLSGAFEKLYQFISPFYPIFLIPMAAATVFLIAETSTMFGFLALRFIFNLVVMLVVLFVAANIIIAHFNRKPFLWVTLVLIRILSYGFFGASAIIAYPEVVAILNEKHSRKPVLGTLFAILVPMGIGVFAILFIFALLSIAIFDANISFSGLFSYIISAGPESLFLPFEQNVQAMGDTIHLNAGEHVPLIQGPLLSLTLILLPIGRMLSLLSTILIAYMGSSGTKKESVLVQKAEPHSAEQDLVFSGEPAQADPEPVFAISGQNKAAAVSSEAEKSKKEEFLESIQTPTAQTTQGNIRFGSRKKANVLSIPFRISVLVLLLVMLGGYGAITTVVNFEGTRVSMYGVSNVIMNTNLGFIETRIEDYFGQSQQVAASFDVLRKTGHVDIFEFDDLETIFQEGIINNYDTLASVFIGLPNGEFVLVGRDDVNGGFRRRQILKTREGTREIYTFDNNPEANINQIVDSAYDPRVRPWYKLAASKKVPAWTDLYIFASSEVIGATYAYPFFNERNELIGVLGIDIDLRDLSLFLSELNVTSQVQGLIYIYDSNTYEMVASSTDADNAYSYLYYQNEESASFDPIRYKASDNPSNEIRLSFEAFSASKTQSAGSRSEFLNEIFSIEILQTLSQQFTGSSESIQIDEEGNFVRFPVDSAHYYGLYSDVHVSDQLAWKLAMIIPEAPLLEIATRSTIVQFIVTVIALIFIGILGNMLANRISRPLEFLANEMLQLRELKIIHREKIRSNISEVNKIDDVIAKLKQGLESFRRYLPAEVVRELLRINKAASIGAERKDITLFFSDIQNFTDLSEFIEPEKLLHQLELYFNAMSKCILNERGTIDKYIGDSVMAFWGAPWKIENHAESACRAAIRCCQEIAKLPRSDFQKTRIGIHSSEVLVGNVGSDYRLNYTALGDGVNLASRLESLNKFYGTTILMSEETQSQVQNSISHRFIDRVTVKGKSNVTEIYEILGEQGDISLLHAKPLSSDLKKTFFLHYQEGSYFFRSKQWGKAAHHFAKACSLLPDDIPTQKLYAKSYRLFQKGETAEFDEVTRLDKK